MEAGTKLRYYDASGWHPVAPKVKPVAHSEFLRTGRISRERDDWLPKERRYLTYAEVATRTGRKLETAGETTHERLNAFHHDIKFPKVLFHRTFPERPHLGYCHVTAASTYLARRSVSWSFYICNFFAQIGEDEQFFAQIDAKRRRMYFAVAIEGEPGTAKMRINRDLRDNGVLFQTANPQEALRNVLMLGAPDSAFRAILQKM
ncbi:DUF6656 family protein [Neorhizobium sp. NPDC001467]|uniref:DUF6656 family protein n=1 Tax=Neorhizobium sp. NPDC001467 TaxID=3390595 RepID=UPI003D0758B3